MKITRNEISAILESLDELVELKVLIRSISPSYDLDDKTFQLFINSLSRLENRLRPLFSKYSQLKKSYYSSTDLTRTTREKLLKLREKKSYIMVSSNSSKKKLKKLKFDPRQIIGTGGPIFPEDYVELNPNLSEQALNNIKKKCQHNLEVLRQIDWSKHSLVFIYEEGNTAEELMRKKINKLSFIIKTKIEVISIPSWKNFSI